MNPMERTYGGFEGWGEGVHGVGAYGAFARQGRFQGGQGSYDSYREDLEYDPRRRFDERGEHVWRGGVLGWLGSGVRAGAAWVGHGLQTWGSLLGGKLKGTGEEWGRAMRGRGERVGGAMEERGESMGRRYGYAGRPPRSYRRPDDRVLDDVHQRIAFSGVDADEVEIEVNNGVVTLSGRVPRRFDKRLVEELAEQVFGVAEVQNHLRLARRVDDRSSSGESAGTRASGNGEGPAYGSEPRM